MLSGIINKKKQFSKAVFVLVIETLLLIIYFEFRASDFEFRGQAQTLKSKTCLVPACPG
jgi:hypothetical protein